MREMGFIDPLRMLLPMISNSGKLGWFGAIEAVK